MSLQLGDTAPDFTADSTSGRTSLYDYAGNSWLVFFSHPKDYTPVCTTELGAFARRKGEFDARNTRIIGLSVDSVEDHHGWAADIKDVGGTALNYPLLADPERKVAGLYGMIHPKADSTATVRSIFFIDPQKKVRTVLTYPASAGRNIDEVLRILDSLQLTAKHKVSTPVNWKPGKDIVISGSVSDEEARKVWPEGWRSPKPYMRIARQPH